MTQPIKTLPMPGEVFEVNGHAAFLIPPLKDSRAGGGGGAGKTPWVWYAPTLPGLPDAMEPWMFEKFQAAGMAVAGIDVGESFGSPDGRRLFSVFYEEMVSRRGLSKRPCLLPRSRGGLMLMNWAAEHPEAVACVAGIYPVFNIRSYPGLAQACGAYRMTEEQLEAHLAEHNPIDRLAPLAKARVPIYNFTGDIDTVVPMELNSGELTKRYRELGGEATIKIAPGQGHNYWPGFFQNQELVDFVIANGKA